MILWDKCVIKDSSHTIILTSRSTDGGLDVKDNNNNWVNIRCGSIIGASATINGLLDTYSLTSTTVNITSSLTVPSISGGLNNNPIVFTTQLGLNAPTITNNSNNTGLTINSSTGVTINGQLSVQNNIIANNINAKVNIAANNGTITALSFIATSDQRLKTNLMPWHSRHSILDLPIYEFDFTSDGSHHIGCLAQDLQKICPELVHQRSDGYLTIEETKLVYLLLQEVKALKQEIESLKRG